MTEGHASCTAADTHAHTWRTCKRLPLQGHRNICVIHVIQNKCKVKEMRDRQKIIIIRRIILIFNSLSWISPSVFIHIPLSKNWKYLLSSFLLLLSSQVFQRYRVILFGYPTLSQLSSSPHPLTQELCLFHGWEVVICYRQLGKQSGLPLIWTRDHQENHIRAKACLNIAVIAAIISCCLFDPHLLL